MTDKFYTIPSVSKHCIDTVGKKIKWSQWDLVVEPSAGNGSFLKQIPTQNKIGIDILPEDENITKCDFFDYKPPKVKKILVIGNPPFGKVSSLAVKFFNHSATFAAMIAFIVPRTFRRTSVQNKLDMSFHIVHDEDIPPRSFEPHMNAKCCFQIWIKKRSKRSIQKLKTTHEDWEFLKFGPKDSNNQPTPPEGADFALRAYGGKCGEIVTENLSQLRPKSWHWIKSKIDKNELIKRFNDLDYSVSNETARQNSIGRGDLVKLYLQKF